MISSIRKQSSVKRSSNPFSNLENHFDRLGQHYRTTKNNNSGKHTFSNLHRSEAKSLKKQWIGVKQKLTFSEGFGTKYNEIYLKRAQSSSSKNNLFSSLAHKIQSKKQKKIFHKEQIVSQYYNNQKQNTRKYQNQEKESPKKKSKITLKTIKNQHLSNKMNIKFNKVGNQKKKNDKFFYQEDDFVRISEPEFKEALLKQKQKNNQLVMQPCL